MAKKIVKRRKIRLFNFLLVLLVLLGLFFAVYQIIEMPIKNIIIKNTTYYQHTLPVIHLINYY